MKRVRRFLRRWRLIAITLLIPTVSRERMIEAARKRGACQVIEPAYATELPFRRGIRRVDEFVVVSIPDVVLVGPAGLPITPEGRVVVEPVSSPRGRLYLPAVQRTLDAVGLRWLLWLVWFPRRTLRHLKAPSIPAGVHVITRASPRPGGSQYAHWFLEHAVQIVATEQFRDMLPSGFEYVTNAEVQSYQAEFFEVMGIGDERIRPQRDEILHVRDLQVVTLRNGHSRGSEFDPRAYRRLRERLAVRDSDSLGALSSGDRPTIVAMLRADARTRRAANLNEARAVVERFGGYLLPDAGSLFQQLDLLRDCEVLIGIYGAGLAKMVLCPNLRHVIEIVPSSDWKGDIYANLAGGLDADYRRITGSPVNSDIDIPIGELEAALASALEA